MEVFSGSGVIPTPLTLETGSPIRAESVFSPCSVEWSGGNVFQSAALLPVKERPTDRTVSQS